MRDQPTTRAADEACQAPYHECFDGRLVLRPGMGGRVRPLLVAAAPMSGVVVNGDLTKGRRKAPDFSHGDIRRDGQGAQCPAGREDHLGVIETCHIL